MSVRGLVSVGILYKLLALNGFILNNQLDSQSTKVPQPAAQAAKIYQKAVSYV